MAKQSTKGYIPSKCTNLDYLPHIKGYDFNNGFDFGEFIKSYSTTGFQAANLGNAIEIIRKMIDSKAKIFLAFTSNMISSGVRETIRYMVEHKMVHAIITSAGGIEEDIIKTMNPFVLGSFRSDGKYLFEQGVNRTGNLFITNDRYTDFEKFMNPFLENLYKEQKKNKKIFCACDILNKLGGYVKDKSSYLHWANKNKIPVFCPALTDGSLGDLLFFKKQKYRDFQVDIVEDMQRIVRLALNSEKTGLIVLGGGVAKHYTLNAQIFREGCDYAVYVNTGNEFDGSDSGAATDEAVTWGKIKANAMQTKVSADATLVFPLIMAGVLDGLKKK